MSVESNFSEAVSSKIGNYVYRLIDPRSGETFYVGQGTGNRVFDHVKGALKLKDGEDVQSTKLDRIRAIRNEHLSVIHIIHRHNIPEAAVDEVEGALIDAFPGLTNIQGGIGSGSYGPMSTQQIIDKYELPELEFAPERKLVLINIARLDDRNDWQPIYDQVRFAWRISPRRASQAELVLAVFRGIVIGAFEVDQWLPATAKNFPGFAASAYDSGRSGFIGKRACDDDWQRFVGARGKRIVNEAIKHGQNPVRYWGI